MREYGLIGYPLSHSFSQAYFTEKFERLGLTDYTYRLFPLEHLDELPALLRAHPHLQGLNVTIPYKEAVLPYLHRLSPEAARIGAVNTVRLEKAGLSGYNTDVIGFEHSLVGFLKGVALAELKALVLGTGGAAKAVVYVLDRLGIAHTLVSRRPESGDLVYDQLTPRLLETHRLIINTTPLGMYPNVHTRPELPYDALGSGHFLYDLVYNPEKTLFLIEGEKRQAWIHNGLAMLQLQAEAAWKIWNPPTPNALA